MSVSCVSIHPRKRQSAKQPRAASSCSKNGVRQFQKARVPRVAPGKIIKAQNMLIEGYSQREIGRVLHLSPHTVAKVIKTEDFVRKVRGSRVQLPLLDELLLSSARLAVYLCLPCLGCDIILKRWTRESLRRKSRNFSVLT
jgi:hypothetical protein